MTMHESDEKVVSKRSKLGICLVAGAGIRGTGGFHELESVDTGGSPRSNLKNMGFTRHRVLGTHGFHEIESQEVAGSTKANPWKSWVPHIPRARGIMGCTTSNLRKRRVPRNRIRGSRGFHEKKADAYADSTLSNTYIVGPPVTRMHVNARFNEI